MNQDVAKQEGKEAGENIAAALHALELGGKLSKEGFKEGFVMALRERLLKETDEFVRARVLALGLAVGPYCP